MNPSWPNLFLVGAAKAGTSSLHTFLNEHPDIFMTRIKEPRYFSRATPAAREFGGVRVMSETQAYLALFRGGRAAMFRGESSPCYLWDAHACRAIKREAPDARIVISLRGPIERAYSHYMMNVAHGLEPRAFGDVVRDEVSQGVVGGYVHQSLYAESVRRYIDAFGRERVKIVEFAALQRDRLGVLADITAFLGVPPLSSDLSHREAHNPFAVPRFSFLAPLLASARIKDAAARVIPARSRAIVRNRLLTRRARRPPLDPEIRAALHGAFEPDLDALEMVLGHNLDSLREKKRSA